VNNLVVVTAGISVSHVVYGQYFVGLLSTRCCLEPGLLPFSKLLITTYEPAAEGVCKIESLIFGVISGKFT
jgi:hypothetical protein